MFAWQKRNAPTALEIQNIVDDIKTNHHDFMVREMQKMRHMLRELAETYAADGRTHELRKRFEHFTRNFIEHMDTEESILFPWVLAEMGLNQIVTTIEIDTSLLKQLSIEDSIVSQEFAFILAQARVLSTSDKLSRSYTCAYDRLCLIQENLTVHMQKEHDFILPIIEKKLSRFE